LVPEEHTFASPAKNALILSITKSMEKPLGVSIIVTGASRTHGVTGCQLVGWKRGDGTKPCAVTHRRAMACMICGVVDRPQSQSR
jgi:hypothetical protein